MCIVARNKPIRLTKTNFAPNFTPMLLFLPGEYLRDCIFFYQQPVLVWYFAVVSPGDAQWLMSFPCLPLGGSVLQLMLVAGACGVEAAGSDKIMLLVKAKTSTKISRIFFTCLYCADY